MPDSLRSRDRLAEIAVSLQTAIEDAMVLREEADSNDGLAAGLVETLTTVHPKLRALAALVESQAQQIDDARKDLADIDALVGERDAELVRAKRRQAVYLDWATTRIAELEAALAETKQALDTGIPPDVRRRLAMDVLLARKAAGTQPARAVPRKEAK